MKRTILVASLVLATAWIPTAFASEQDGDAGGTDSRQPTSETKSAEPDHVGGGRGEPQRAQDQRREQAAWHQDELTSTQRKVLADWRAVEQLQQRVP